MNAARTIRDLRRLIAQEWVSAELIIIVVHTETEAAALKFPGTPTVRIDGQEIEPSNPVELPRYSLDCRLYWYEGQFWARPSEQMPRQALQWCSSTSDRKFAPISTADESIEKDR